MSINEHKVNLFDANNSAIVCYTENKYLYILNKFKSRSYKSPE